MEIEERNKQLESERATLAERQRRLAEEAEEESRKLRTHNNAYRHAFDLTGEIDDMLRNVTVVSDDRAAELAAQHQHRMATEPAYRAQQEQALRDFDAEWDLAMQLMDMQMAAALHRAPLTQHNDS